MSKHGTKIGWTHMPGYIGETWNPVTGCTKISPGCDNCYAQAILKRNLPGHTGQGVVWHSKRLTEPSAWKAPRCVFLCSMGDLFHEEVPESFIAEVLDIMALHDEHRFLVLTKRARRMKAVMLTQQHLAPIPKNIALGVTAENQAMADERIPLLLRTPAAMRFVSVEPMLGYTSLLEYLPGLDWVICGGETGPGARVMDVDDANEISAQCCAWGVPFYFKQMSNKAAIPEKLQIRQFPEWSGIEDSGGDDE